jgi:hypothetical protein
MTARPTTDAPQRPHEVAIVGNDMLLAALPGRPVQLAHAVQACGFDLVVPVSWGEELLAEHALRQLEQRGAGPLVFCACPRVRARLTAAGSEIAHYLLSTLAPPAATARYLRALEPEAPMRITYLGSCEGARDPSIDARVLPADFLRHLDVQGISVVRQPSVYETTIPPDRRRHWSLPGGAPSADAVEARGTGHRLLVIEERDLAAEIAQHIIAGDRLIIDPAASVGCFCAGAYEVLRGIGSRDAVLALEPPRSALPVVDVDRTLALDLPLPQVPLREVTEPREPERPAAPEGVHSIQEAARLRAERRRIAVTPANIGAAGQGRTPDRPPPAERPPRAPGGAARPLAPVAETLPDRGEPGLIQLPPTSTAAAAEETSHAAPQVPPPAQPPTEAPAAGPTVPEAAPPAATPPVVEVEPPPVPPHEVEPEHERAGEVVPELTRKPRHSPTYELRQVARAAAHLRQRETGAPAKPPRAYAALRSRVGRARAPTPVTTTAVAEPPPEVSGVELGLRLPPLEPPPRPVEPLPVPSELHRAAQAALRTKRRALAPEPRASERTLWSLLATAILIAAIALLLFVIFGT